MIDIVLDKPFVFCVISFMRIYLLYRVEMIL